VQGRDAGRFVSSGGPLSSAHAPVWVAASVPHPFDAVLGDQDVVEDRDRLGDWVVRVVREGGLRRAECLIAGAPPVHDDPIGRAEVWCLQRDLRPVFRFSDASAAPRAEIAVRERGYVVRSRPSVVLRAGTRKLLGLGATPPVGRVLLSDAPDERWIATRAPHTPRSWIGRWCDDLARIPGPVAFAGVRDGGGVLRAVGQVVVRGDLATLSHIATEPGHRRRGLGAEIVAVMARFAADHGAHQIVSVAPEGSEALRLARRIGFVPHHHVRDLVHRSAPVDAEPAFPAAPFRVRRSRPVPGTGGDRP
jgi:GNAT superfamily N-acetyltransferase